MNSGLRLNLQEDINELHQLSGPGKLYTFQKTDSFLHRGNFSTCIETPKNFEDGEIIKSIVGTFVNGTIHGNAKVTFLGGNTNILTFNFGVPHGLNRVFNSNKSLLLVEILSKGSPIGNAWINYNEKIYLYDYRHSNDTLRDKKIDTYHTIVFNPRDSTFLGGTYPRFLDNLYNVYTPKFLNFHGKSDDCVKILDWKKSEPHKELIYSLENSKIIPDTPSDDFFSDSSSLSPPERLIKFKKYLLVNKTIFGHLYQKFMSPVDEDIKVPLLTDIKGVKGHKAYEGVLRGEKVMFTHHRGLLDENNLLHGNTWLKISSENQSRDLIFNTTISYLALQFRHGQILDEMICIGFEDGRFGYAKLVSQTLHGSLLIHGAVPVLPIKHVKKHIIQDTGSVILHYENGRNTGPFWIGMFGLGALTGSLNESGYVSGESIAYLYPDMETSYIGKFEDKIMKEAYLGDVSDVSFDSGPIPLLKFKMSSEMEGEPFYYEPPTNGSIGAGPYVLDPYDQKRVYLSDAGEFGEGVHVKKDMAVGEVACLYNYHIYYPEDRAFHSKSCTQNLTKSDDERRHCIKYSLAIQYLDAAMNIPPEKDIPGMFLPTLGMKLNHKFYDSHASFLDFESPRWGIVSSIGLYFKSIKKGEQLFVDYGYSSPGAFPADFPWFWELKNKVDQEIKEKEKLEQSKALKKLKKRKKKKNQGVQDPK
ncbi:uncharacterized protein [Lepeophtheirus salmonis]|uniref:uncharacterized protein n=1 Tax=Lepeophtheirus salmonis TaxID=72036 RepID=UPI003AF3695E